MLGIIIRFEIEIEMIWKFPTPEKTHTHTPFNGYVKLMDSYARERERMRARKQFVNPLGYSQRSK